MSELRATQATLEALSAGETLRATSLAVEVISIEVDDSSLRATSVALEVLTPSTFPPQAPVVSASAEGVTITASTGEMVTVEEGASHSHTRWQVRLATDTDWETPLVDESTSTFLTSVVLSDFFTPAENTAYDIRAAHADRGQFGPFSAAVQVTTGTALPAPNAPTISDPPDEVGVDFVRSTMSAFSHPEGQTTAEDFDPEDPLPFLLEVHWQIDVAAGDYSDPVYDSERDGGPPIPEDALELYYEGLAAGTAHKMRGRQRDGLYGTLSPWSNEVTFTTLEVPAERPAAPTLTLVECSHERIRLTSDAMVHTDGTAVHTRTHWRACQGSCTVHITAEPGELQAHDWPFPPQGAWSLSARYEDDSGRIGDYSTPVACEIDPEPPQVDVMAPVGGVVIDDDTLVEWDVPFEPDGGWTYTVEVSGDGGATWPESVDQSAQSYLFEVLGRPNGRYIIRIRACYPTTSYCGEWYYLTLTLDRTGVSSVSYNFSTLEEIPASWTVRWDGTEQDTHWELVDRDLQTGGDPIGILARHTIMNDQRRSALVFEELGEPRTMRQTTTLAVLGREDIWYFWRYAYANLANGGGAWSMNGLPTDTLEDRTGVIHVVSTGNQPWPCPTRACDCVHMPELVCLECRAATLEMARKDPSRVWTYGTSIRRAYVDRMAMRLGTTTPSFFTRQRAEPDGDRERGMTIGERLKDPVDETCRYRPVWYTVEQWVERVGDDYRFRAKILGPGLDPSVSHHVQGVLTAAQVASGYPCGPCGLGFSQLRGLDQTIGVLFRSVTLELPEGIQVSGPIYGTPTVEVGP